MPGDRRRDSHLHAERRDEKRRKARYGMRVSGKGARLLDRLLRQKSRQEGGKAKGKPAGRRGRT